MGLEVQQQAAIGHLEAVLRARVGARATASAAPAIRRLCPELDCLRGWLSKDSVAAAERRAITVGTGADRVLVSAGQLDEYIYVRLLGDALGIAFEPLETTTRDTCPLDDRRLIEAPAAGVLPLIIDGELKAVIAPSGFAARNITELVRSNPKLAQRFRLTTPERLQTFVSLHAERAIGEQAAGALSAAWPDLSAGPPRLRGSLAPAVGIGAIALLILLFAPGAVTLGFEIVLTLIFLAWMMLRVAGALLGRQIKREPRRRDERDLPIYTVMVALYREVAALGGLIAALRRLDYPAEKLDIKLIVEPDDADTRRALEGMKLGPPFEVIVAPPSGPRTKPKALNTALPFARGSYTVIYDAEDRPEPGQLRQALDAFLANGEELACVQASLTIDNTADNWLTGLFTAEYAGQFDVFLPALAQFRLPLPLGGSSNHFRTATLRAVGAWDPYNVTEDADLGLRLARFGFRSGVIERSTYEEAPARLGPWLRQRTRWFKGWMQTWLVHMREPRKLRRELGLGAFFTMQLIVGGNVLASLMHPLLILWVASALAQATPIEMTSPSTALFAVTVVTGYFASVLLGAVGLFRRGLATHCWVLLLVPLHWLLLAAAAWRALYQLLRDPYRWEKTEHGLARTSRATRRSTPPP